MMKSNLTPRLNRYIKNFPHIKQAAFLLLPQREALFGGAAGGGKSDALLMAALQYFDVPGYSALILRTNRQSLSLPDGLIPRSHEWLKGTGAVWKAQDNTWHSPEGATLTFGYLRSADDKYNYASSAYQCICFEELTEFKREDDYTFMFSRLRKTIGKGDLSRVPLRMRNTTNPIGPGYAWVKARFVDQPPTRDRIFLPSTIDDNPSLDSAEYEKSLEELSPIVRAKLRNGDWTAIEAGEYFDPDLIIAGTPPREFVNRVVFWDLAGSEVSAQNKDPDYTCGIDFAVDSVGRYWILGVELFREGPATVQAKVRRAAQLRGKDIYYRMFRDPAQAGKDQALNYVRLMKGYDFGAVPISGDAITLADGIAAQVGGGNVHIAPNIGPDLAEFFTQLKGFPYARHDDAVSALSGAFNFLIAARPKRKQLATGKRIY